MTTTKKSSSSPGRPRKPETLDSLRDKSERATLKLCARLRIMTETAASRLISRIGGEGVSVKDHAAAVEALARAAKLVAETEGAVRKAGIGDTEGSSRGVAPRTAEELLGGLKELK